MKIEELKRKCTPGPWTWMPPTNPKQYSAIVVGPEDDDGSMPVICDVGKRADKSSCEANARLIAAAPRLLEALQQIANVSCSDWDVMKWASNIQQIAEAAIAELEESDESGQRDLLHAADEALNALTVCCTHAGGDQAAISRAKTLLRSAIRKAKGES